MDALTLVFLIAALIGLGGICIALGEELVVIEEVPATGCEYCGEQVFTPEVTPKYRRRPKRENR